jgi:hypothetical protein
MQTYPTHCCCQCVSCLPFRVDYLRYSERFTSRFVRLTILTPPARLPPRHYGMHGHVLTGTRSVWQVVECVVQDLSLIGISGTAVLAAHQRQSRTLRPPASAASSILGAETRRVCSPLRPARLCTWFCAFGAPFPQKSLCNHVLVILVHARARIHVLIVARPELI